VVLEPSNHLGGLSSGGLGDTDFGKKNVIGGLSLSFYEQIGRKYGKDEPVWLFEPKAASAVFQDWIDEFGIDVRLQERLDRSKTAVKAGGRITQITMASGKVFEGNIFMDATYEGDLMAQCGVSYATGREANRVYG